MRERSCFSRIQGQFPPADFQNVKNLLYLNVLLLAGSATKGIGEPARRSLGMNGIAKIFENFSGIVSISDPETDELLFLNRQGRKMMQLEEGEEVRRSKYAELIQLLGGPAAFRPARRLEEGEFYEWDCFNAEAGHYYDIKDTLIQEDGKRRLLEIAINIDAQELQSERLQNMISNERMINMALAVALNENDPDEAIEVMLHYLGEQLKCDRVFIYEENEGGTFNNTYEWCKEGVKPQIGRLKNLPFTNLIDSWYREFDEDHNILIQDVEDYREAHPLMYDLLRMQDIHSLVVGPIIEKNKRLGFYGVGNPPIERMENISMLYETLGHFITALLRNRNNMAQIERQSRIDQLTGLNNRHALSPYLYSIHPEKRIGYIFWAINGLKRVNDTFGHKEGDILIRKTAEILQKTFAPLPVFRMGGDEFLTVGNDLSEEWVKQKVKDLRRDCAKQDISLAIGYVWHENAEEMFDTLFKEVDQKMYMDKRKYYGDRRHAFIMGK